MGLEMVREELVLIFFSSSTFSSAVEVCCVAL